MGLIRDLLAVKRIKNIKNKLTNKKGIKNGKNKSKLYEMW